MRYLSIACFFTAMACGGNAEAAGEKPITISSAVAPVLVAGKLTGCAINFEAGRYDPEYNNGKLVYLTGSLNFYLYPDKPPFFALKLGVKPDPQKGFVAPAEAFLISGTRSNKQDLLKRFDGEQPGFALFMYNPDNATLEAAAQAVLESNNLTIAYAMRPDGTDALVPIDVTISKLDFDDPAKSLTSPTAPEEWVKCIQSVMDGHQ